MPKSLSGRLLLGSAAATTLALGLVLALMHQVLVRFVTGQIDQRLDNKIVALASQIRVAPDGTITLDGQADGPPFDKRDHRSFWMVRGPSNALATRWLAPADFIAPSASTLDGAFARPAPPPPGPGGLKGHPRTINGNGFGGAELHERVARTTVGVALTIIVAAPAAAINGPVREAMTTVALGVLTLGVALVALAFVQVRLGLRPLTVMRKQVADVGEGRRDFLPEDQPREVRPLVVEMNNLLERNVANLEKARRHVANLAHGLKTPLATLQLGVEHLDGPGKDDLRLLLAQIDLRIRHHLGRARAGALAGPERARTNLSTHLADIGDALKHIHADRSIAFALECPTELSVACEANDVDEIFGNLLDNAFKFARRSVACSARIESRRVIVEIVDDGPGLSIDEVIVVIQPGQRIDEQMPGFGFGLTIAHELTELYGGKVRLEPGSLAFRCASSCQTHQDRFDSSLRALLNSCEPQRQQRGAPH